MVDNFRAALKATAGKPEEIELAIQLAEVYRRGLKQPSAEERRALANQVVDEMVAAHQEQPAAWIARYLYQQRNDGTGADPDLTQALALDTEKADARVQLAAAEWAKSRGESELASEYYERVIDADPTSERAYVGLAQLQASQQEYEPAIATLKRGLQAVRTDDRLNLELTLATVYLSAQKLKDADELLVVLNRRASAIQDQISPDATARIRSTLDALRAQWHMEKRQYSQAVQLLKGSLSAQPTAAAGQDMMRRVQSLAQLGQCYTALRHWDQAAMAFQEAASLQPQELGPQIAAAKAWQSAGRTEETLRVLNQAAARSNATDEVWALLADAQIRQQVSAANKSRHWKAIEQTLAKGLKLFPDSKLLESVKFQLEDLSAGTQKSLSRIEEALAARPQSRLLAERLMLAYEAEGQKDKADEIEEKFLTASEDVIDKLLLRATWNAARQKFDETHALLQEAVHEAPEDRQAEIKFRLARLAMYLGKMDEARSTLKELVSSDSHNEILHEMLADLALETQDLNDLAHWEEELKKLEGSDGTGWRFYRVQRLLNQEDGPNEQQFQEAERLTADIERIRPMWATGFVLQGLIAQRRGRLEEAIEAYRKAIDLGDRRPLVSEQLLSLLYTTNRTEEIDKHLARLGDAGRALAAHGEYRDRYADPRRRRRKCPEARRGRNEAPAGRCHEPSGACTILAGLRQGRRGGGGFSKRRRTRPPRLCGPGKDCLRSD